MIDGDDRGVGDRGDNHLGDAVGVVDGEGLFGEIDQGDEELASVVGVDGSWGVGQGDAVVGGKP